MTLNFPIVRSGLVVESNLDLDKSQALMGVDFLDKRCVEFEDAITAELNGIGATEISVLDSDPISKKSNPKSEDIYGCGLRFRKVTFNYGGFSIEGRAGVTICDGPRQSKIAVRILCMKVGEDKALNIGLDDAIGFFDISAAITEPLIAATKTAYLLALTEFVEANDEVVTKCGGELQIHEKVGFNMRAYDTQDDSITNLIEELNRGGALPRVLRSDRYRRVFEELWGVAHDMDVANVEVPRAIDTLRSDDGATLVFLEDSFVDQKERVREEQKALILSSVVYLGAGTPMLSLTGVMTPPDDVTIYDEDIHTFAAHRISGNVVREYAGQF